MKYSIITINLNNAAGLESTIKSVISQSCTDYEYIIIDGSSADGSVDVIKKYEERISQWISEEDSGIYNAMNKGIKLANGEFLLFLNSGDYFFNNQVLENVKSKLIGVNGIYYGNLVLIDNKGRLEYLNAENKLTLWHFCKSTVWHPSTFIRKQLFEKYGLYDESLKIAADYDFFLKAFCINRTQFKYIDKFISVFNTEGICNDVNMYNFQMKEILKIQKRYYKMRFSLFFFRIYNREFGLRTKLRKKIKALGRLLKDNRFLLKYFYDYLNNKKRFTRYYKSNTFNSQELKSGEGSTLKQTTEIRNQLSCLLKEYNIKVLIDAPCGDFNWMKHVDLDCIDKYYGADIVQEIIEKNRIKFTNDKIEFICSDIVNDLLPIGDVVLCRDCLVHLDFKDAKKAINNFKNAGIKYLLITTFTDRKDNKDLLSGDIWRTLNMELPPFSFPEPLNLINERCTESDNMYTDKSLGLYKLEDIFEN